MADMNIASWISGQVDILTNIAKNLEPVDRLLTGAAYLIGLSFAFKAIYTLKVYGEARTMMSSHTSIKEPVMYIFVAGIFLFIPTAFQMLLNTAFGYTNVLAYAPVNSSNNTLDALFGPNSAVGRPLSMLIQTIGLIAFIRGWVLVARSAAQGQPPGGTGKGLMHVFGGILAMNIVGTIQIINNTLYG
ncbi:type IV secretion protein IcmC [Legionella yabuuchiae]|uniref:type IV secretion protein IcmC n=1 Tax=Legionella yabuuchiae TaxID=376727 RepID=UPI0010550759|nr:type IV secretion protein IcmC [Legionella yabuuchiae]